jgi:hypothetical protein
VQPSELARLRASGSGAADVQGSVPEPADGDGVDGGTALGLAMTGVALLTTVGWVMERRRRLAQRAVVPVEATASALAPSVETLAVPETPETLANLTSPATPANTRTGRAMGVSAQKKLIRFFLGLRSVAGAATIAAVIGMVVFWSIDATDPAGREPRLNLALFGLLLAGWAGFWGGGWLANSLHRAAFNRNHPKFDN